MFPRPRMQFRWSTSTRPDEVRPSLSVEAALSGAPATEANRFRVPRILDEE